MVGRVATGVTENGSISIPLTADKFEEVRKAKEGYLFAWALEEKLALLIDNFYEFEVELLKLAEQAILWSERDFQEDMRQRLLLDRRLVNILTACRLYLDQSDHGISRFCGAASDELKSVKMFKNRLYDDNWGYRLMEAVRNHAQHLELPVGAISYNYRRKPGNPEEWEYRVIPQLLLESVEQGMARRVQAFLEDAVNKPVWEFFPLLLRSHLSTRIAVRA